MRRATWGISLAFLALLILASPSHGQVITGEIFGAVTDQNGAAVPGASVAAVCVATNLGRTVTTDQAGNYRVPNLPVCVHKVTVTARGFRTEVRQADVQAGITLKADFRLQVGQKSETVTVEAAAPLVDYSTNGTTEVDQKAIVDLPTEGRDFKSILALTPGVQRIAGGGFLDVSINGQRTTTNNYLVDGMPNNDRFYGSEVVGQPGILGIPAAVLGNDVIAEYSVQQLPSAEYGLKGGAAVNVVLKSGTNQFHGSAYYFGDYDWLNAKNFFSTTTTPYHNHNYGATFGGPIVKDRTFFFVNFEGQRNSSLEPYTVNIPTEGDMAAALANFSNPAINTSGLPLNPAGLALLSYYPCSNGAGGAVQCTPAIANAAVPTGGFFQTEAPPNTDKLSSFLIKIDHKMNTKMSVSGRYLFADSTQSAPAAGFTIPPVAGSGLGADGFNTIAPTRVQLAGGTWTYTISPNKILDVRFSWSRYSQILDTNNKINPLSLGIDTGPLSPADYAVPPVYASSTFGNIGGILGYPLSTRPTQTYDTSVHFTWIRGSHTFKIGGNYQYGSTFSLRNRARTSLYSFQTDWPTVLTQFLLGRFDQASRSFGDTSRHLYQPSMGVYFQDEWKVRPRLTVSYGLRWDVNGALGEADKAASNFYPCAGQEPNFCSPVSSAAGFPGLAAVGIGNSRLYNLDLHDFGPRAGVAWDVFGNGKTALRVGYSMLYDVANFAAISAPYPFQGARAGAFTNPAEGVFSVTAAGNATPGTNNAILFEALGANTCYNPAVNTVGVTPDWVCFGPQPGSAAFGGSTTTPFQTYGANPTATPPFDIFGTVSPLRTPRIQYYSLSVQHELFRNNVISVGYYGAYGTDLLMDRELNLRPVGCFSGGVQLTSGPDPTNPTLSCSRPFDLPQFASSSSPTGYLYNYVTQLTNDGYSRYNSLQVTYRQRNFHGIDSIVNFTWGNCIDTDSVNRGGAGVQPIEMNPYVPGSSQGPCDTDVRLNFNAGVTYDFPKWRAAGRFGEGWQTGLVTTDATGRPWTPFIVSGIDNSGQDLTYQRPDCLQKPHYDFDNPNGFITNAATAFGPPADGTIGTCGRNSLRGPPFNQMDFNVNKTTKITERISIQLRLEIFNILNHPNFNATPANNVAAVYPASGYASYQANPYANGFATVTTTPDIYAGNPFLSQGGPRAIQLGAKVIF